MNAEIAKIMIENLIDRIEVNPQTGKRFLKGAISDREFEAIGFALALVGGDPVPITPAGAVPVGEPEEVNIGQLIVRPIEVELNLASLKIDEPDNQSVTLCLDFGTAMSKAFATMGSDDQLLGLPLGRRSGEPHMLFPVSSTLFFDRKGKIYFGYEAIKESLNEPDQGRLRFDSPKQHMSRGDFDHIVDRPVGKDINPTSFEFTNGELITLYLSFLTDLACCELEERDVSRHVLRRFALPCWQPERADWADRKMREMLAKAQILADTFSGRWNGGLDAAVVRGAFDALQKCGSLPSCLVEQGVLEAIAAASSGLPRGTGQRRLYMIVDVGAGTTDYGLFVVITPKKQDDRPKIFEVPNTTVVLRQAGDTVDKILLRCILEKEGIESGDPEYDHVNSDLLLRIRTLKEDMFRNGTATYILATDAVGTIELNDFLSDSRVAKFENLLRSHFLKSLENAPASWIEPFAKEGIIVVLTGGGAKLPIVRTLGQDGVSVHGVSLACTLAPYAPVWLTERYPDLEDEFPQLAVSIGGAAEELPHRGHQYTELGILAGPPITGLEPQYK